MLGILRVPARGLGRRGMPSDAAISVMYARACLCVCFPVFGGGLAECDLAFLVLAGLDLRLIVEDCLFVGVQGFVVAVGGVISFEF